jgi:TonB family protein
MRRRILFTSLWLAGTLSLLFASQNAPSQSTAGSDKAETGAVLVKLSTPEYPPLARMARIFGEVKVTVTIRKDGALESAEGTGHPLLRKAALDSAGKSTFECRGCTKEATRVLTFSYEFDDSTCTTNGPLPPPKVTWLRDRITIAVVSHCVTP